jgi:hypothetical protein
LFLAARLQYDLISKSIFPVDFVATSDPSSPPNAIMQQNEVAAETDLLPAEKRPRTEDLLMDGSDGYGPDSLRCRQAGISFGFASRMNLPEATMNAYFMTNEYFAIKDKYTTEHIRKGWELFRRLGYCEALGSYTIEELQEGLEYITDGILPFYERIHRDEIERHNRRELL